jgi:mono/diheme cytochrome c family protein
MRSAASALVAVALAAPAWAQDGGRGRALYETHCVGCHYERIHKRERSRSLVGSLAALRVEVARRAALVKRPFTVEDLDDIAAYLNRSHYKFDK